MCTVSPARKSVRSSTVCATTGPVKDSGGRSNRNGSMPWSQDECTMPTSPPASAMTSRPPERPRSAGICRQSKKRSGNRRGHDGSASSDDSPAKRASPSASVVPVASVLPVQSVTETRAPATGSAPSSVVTQTRDASRPHLRCTDRFVTSAAVGT
jgi:hypothetical protein